ncbi:TPA: succinate dehydrogenase, hydrophobic membrane anchor protein, partial [Pseudomonas aeruginosa]|nr:succinate dehydrogenase, hydrophobic membrane anchor protein [Pseudomonas aeruginosa]
MVTNVTNFSRSGLYDWMAQRVSAVVLAAYVIFLLGYLIAHPNISYADWHGLFSQGWMRIFSLLTLVALSV